MLTTGMSSRLDQLPVEQVEGEEVRHHVDAGGRVRELAEEGVHPRLRPQRERHVDEVDVTHPRLPHQVVEAAGEHAELLRHVVAALARAVLEEADDLHPQPGRLVDPERDPLGHLGQPHDGHAAGIAAAPPRLLQAQPHRRPPHADRQGRAEEPPDRDHPAEARALFQRERGEEQHRRDDAPRGPHPEQLALERDTAPRGVQTARLGDEEKAEHGRAGRPGVGRVPGACVVDQRHHAMCHGDPGGVGQA